MTIQTVTVDREQLEQWLECAKRCESIDGMYGWADTITAIKEALAQSAVTESHKQEPVGEIVECSVNGQQTVVEIDGRWKFLKYGTKLYTTPPQPQNEVRGNLSRKPLTDEQMLKIWLTVPAETEDRFAFARAIEAAHGIKE